MSGIKYQVSGWLAGDLELGLKLEDSLRMIAEAIGSFPGNLQSCES